MGQKLIEAGLNDAGQMNETNAGKVASLLTAMAVQGGKDGQMDGAGAGTGAVAPSVFSLRFAPHLPLVAVGAPAGIYYPQVADGLGMALVLPPYADVANAIRWHRPSRWHRNSPASRPWSVRWMLEPPAPL